MQGFDKTSRRTFLRLSASALPLLALPNGRLWAAEGHIPLGVQLYTVRDRAAKDLPGTLKKIRAVGYEQVELFGDSYTYPASQLKGMIEAAGLRAPSGHFDYGTLPQKMEYAKQLGLEWVVCPYLPETMWTLDGFHAAAKKFNECGRRAKDLGMRFGFHNHNYEFASRGSNGKTGFAVLVEETDPELVFFELDCYWIVQAGHDPLKLLKTMGKRISMLHLKGRKNGFGTSYSLDASSSHFAPVGSGSIEWKPIIAEAEKLNVEHYFVEQDDTYGHPFDSISASYKYLRTFLP